MQESKLSNPSSLNHLLPLEKFETLGSTLARHHVPLRHTLVSFYSQYCPNPSDFAPQEKNEFDALFD
jgi:hypothetical protein